jgi:hypothetical protein
MKSALFIAIVMLASGVCAKEARTPPMYSLSVGRVFESTSEKPEWMYILGGTGTMRGGETVCKTPQSLKKLLVGLPRGSSLSWWPTCSGEQRALSEHLDELKEACIEAGVDFRIHPAG